MVINGRPVAVLVAMLVFHHALTAADPRGPCLSCGLSANSDVQGNLGPPSVVTSQRVSNWLKDRWQAAKDMSGTPIPGPHWVAVGLDSSEVLHTVVLDWETAFADDWTLSGRAAPNGSWESLFDHSTWSTTWDACRQCEAGSFPDSNSKAAFDAWGPEALRLHGFVHRHRTKIEGHNHIIDTVRLPEAKISSYAELRVDIARPATRWGSSLWRVAGFGGIPQVSFDSLGGN